jgi:hypothetical protein
MLLLLCEVRQAGGTAKATVVALSGCAEQNRKENTLGTGPSFSDSTHNTQSI